MKEGMSKMSFKPKDIKMCVQDEPKEHKYRLCVFASLMIGVATTYQAYFDGVAYRAGIMQNEALAGMRDFADYMDPLSRDIWSLRKTLAVLDDKPLKDIKYLSVGEGGRGLGAAGADASEGLVGQTYLDNWVYTEDYSRDAVGTILTDNLGQNIELRAYTDGIIYSGPNGDPKANQLYFTETYEQRTREMTQQEHARQVKYETDPIGYSTDRYNEWLTMRENTIWYDTAGCHGTLIGDANQVDITPATVRYNQTDRLNDWPYRGADATLLNTASQQKELSPVSGWWAPWNDRTDEAYLPTFSQERPAVTNAQNFQDGWEELLVRPQLFDSGYGFPVGTKRMDVQVSVNGNVDFWDEDMYRDSIRDVIAMVDDCDIECQQRGSGLSMVAALMAIPYAMFGLTGIMMILGNVTPNCRVGAIFCTLCSGCVLFICLLISATMLFSNYSVVCSRSMTKTAGDGIFWYMADDYRMVVTLWATSWIVLMCFCCCGCANTINVQK